MFWLFLIPAGVLAAMAAATPRVRNILLHAGHTYRFLFELTVSSELTEESRKALLRGLEEMGAKDILLMVGPPLLCMFTQMIAADRTVQLGASYAPFKSIAAVPVVSLRLVQIEHVDAGGGFQAMGKG